MSLDGPLVYAGLCVFVRCAALMMSAPIFGNIVPVNVRVLFSAVMAFALAPVVMASVGPVPVEPVGLVLAVGREILAGLLIGGAVQVLVNMCQAAGALLDLQIGTGAAQVFNPMLGMTATPIAQFKLMLGIVLIFLSNGHLAVFRAFGASFSAVGPDFARAPGEFVVLIGELAVLGVQIAAPVVAVTVVLDISAGLINKAVPQTQPFLLALPVKLALGLLTLSLGLPAFVVGVQIGLEKALDVLSQLMR